MQIPDLALSERRGQNITERNNTHINRRLNRYENLAMSCGNRIRILVCSRAEFNSFPERNATTSLKYKNEDTKK